MASFLLTWNPKKFDWVRLPEALEALRDDGSMTERWNCGKTQKIRPGDTLFLLRQCSDRPGIVGHGYALSRAHRNHHWHGRRAEFTRYVDIRILSLLDASVTPPLDVAHLDDPMLKAVHWSTQSSGISLSADAEYRLSDLWKEYFARVGGRLGRWYSVDEYRGAVQRVWDSLSGKQRTMLQAHAAATDGLLSWKDLARAGGYGTKDAVNSQYGNVGKRIAEALGADRNQFKIVTRFIADDYREPDGLLMWTMEPALRQALAVQLAGSQDGSSPAPSERPGSDIPLNDSAYRTLFNSLGFTQIEHQKALQHPSRPPTVYFNKSHDPPRGDGLAFFTCYRKDDVFFESALWTVIPARQKKDDVPALVTRIPIAGMEREAFTSLLAPDIDALERRLEREIEQRPGIGLTEKERLIEARLGQGIYRDNLLLVEKMCRLTGVSDPKHLRASHIKPWRESNDKEKLDGYNGLMLAPHVDHLFDRGWLSFTDDGEMLVARDLAPALLEAWGIRMPRNVGGFKPEQKKYLAFHRASVFEKNYNSLGGRTA